MFSPDIVDIPNGDPGVVYARVPGDEWYMYAAGIDGSVWTNWSGIWTKMSPFVVQPTSHLGINLQGATGRNKKRWYLQDVILWAFAGPRPTPAHEGAHLNGNRWDNRYTNLAWKTQGQNNEDRTVHRSHTE
jgi:hypothetical protein